jgi:hypothetical protein
MREATVETYLREQVKKIGGRCVKLVPASVVGVPDRLVLLPGGRVIFVEVKRPKGGRFSQKQVLWRDWLVENGFGYAAVFTKEGVDELLGLDDH